MAQYRKKPVVIEAILWDGNLNTLDDIQKPSFNSLRRSVVTNDKNNLLIETLEGIHEGNIGDYIIRGISGEIYPCKPDIFKKTYDKV